MNEYLWSTIADCKKAGDHLYSVDDDGFCNGCGNQESEEDEEKMSKDKQVVSLNLKEAESLGIVKCNYCGYSPCAHNTAHPTYKANFTMGKVIKSEEALEALSELKPLCHAIYILRNKLSRCKYNSPNFRKTEKLLVETESKAMEATTKIRHALKGEYEHLEK